MLKPFKFTFLLRCFSGGLFVYLGLQVALWWIFHTTVLFWGIMRPFQYRQMCDCGKLKYIHLTMGISGLVLPLVPTLICHWTGGFGINLLLHYSCHRKTTLASRYSVYVPLNVIVIVGIGLLLIIFSTIALEVIHSYELLFVCMNVVLL